LAHTKWDRGISGKIPIFALAVRVVAGSNPAAPTNQKCKKSLNNFSRARQTISFGNPTHLTYI
jgi:hypothetical protein